MTTIDKKKTYCFDLDDTLCKTKGLNYEDSKPIKERISFVNKLHEQGHFIIIDSARGSLTGQRWTEKTRKQLKKWGLKYDKLRCGHKFAADIYVDDKALNSEEYFK